MKIIMESSTDILPLIFVPILIAIFTFGSDSYTIEPDSPNIYWTKRSWWGLKQERRPVKWMNQAWHAKTKGGEYYFLFGADHDLPTDR